MNIIHYAGISANEASGVSVVVPQIINAQAELMNICFYNYGKTSFSIDDKILSFNCEHNDDYHTFPEPFNKPDIVVFHSPFGIRRSVNVAESLRRDGIPYVVVPHGCFSLRALKKKALKKFFAMHFFFRKMFSQAAAVQFLSEGEKNSSKYKEKGVVIPNGISIPDAYQRKEIGDGIKLSFIGRKDIYHKGLDLLIEACAKIHSCLKENDVKIYLYGPYENNPKEIKTLISENKVDDIVFDLPAVFGEDKKSVFLNTDVVVLTSRFEGFPCVLLEAWSYGCPTLLTKGTNLGDEAVKHNCGWCTENDVQNIANVILSVIRDKDKIEEKAKAARKYVSANYSWSVIAKRYFNMYIDIYFKRCKNVSNK